MHFEYLYLLAATQSCSLDVGFSSIPGCCAGYSIHAAWPDATALACILVFISLWLEKGLGLIVGGFEPSPLGAIAHYAPTLPEWTIVAGIWAVGAFSSRCFTR